MNTHATGQSHAKIILIGEHSVVYGQPAIALPLANVTTTVTMQSNGKEEKTIDSRFYQGQIDGMPENMAGIRKLLAALIDHFHAENDGWQLQIISDLPAERGMGSSAATAIAIVRAFFNYYGQDLQHAELLQWADIEEKVTHRSPSGLDAATSSSPKPLWFVKGKTSVPIDLNLNATMVIADTGVQGQTKEAINAVKKRLDEEPDATQKLLAHLGRLATDSKSALADDEAEKLGLILNDAQADLKQLGVSSPELDHLCAVARQNGALGAKLTGGGRGGCMFAITSSAMGARRLAAVLTEAGAKGTWIQPLGGND